MSHYTTEITKTLARLRSITGVPPEPEHIESTMRGVYGTLDALSRRQFTTAVRNAVQDIRIPGHVCDHCSLMLKRLRTERAAEPNYTGLPDDTLEQLAEHGATTSIMNNAADALHARRVKAAAIIKIADEYLDIEQQGLHDSADLEFGDSKIGCIKAALEAAYDAGRKAGVR